MSSGPIRTLHKGKAARNRTPYDRIAASKDGNHSNGPQTPSKSIFQRAKEWLTPSSWKKAISIFSSPVVNKHEDSFDSKTDEEYLQNVSTTTEDVSMLINTPVTEKYEQEHRDTSAQATPSIVEQSPNQMLANFFSKKGKTPLNEIEKEGIISILNKSASPSSSVISPAASLNRFQTPRAAAISKRESGVSSEPRARTSSLTPGNTPNSAKQWSAFRSTFSPLREQDQLSTISPNSLLPAQRLSYYGPTLSTPYNRRLRHKRHSTTPISLSNSIAPSLSFQPKKARYESANVSFNDTSFTNVPTSSPLHQSTTANHPEKTPSRAAASLLSILDSKEKNTPSITAKAGSPQSAPSKASYISPYARPGITTSRRRHDQIRPSSEKSEPEKKEPSAFETLEKSSNVQTYKPSLMPEFLEKASTHGSFAKQKEGEQTSLSEKTALSEPENKTPVFSFKAPSATTDKPSPPVSSIFSFNAPSAASTKPSPAVSSTFSFNAPTTTPSATSFSIINKEKPARSPNETIDVDLEEEGSGISAEVEVANEGEDLQKNATEVKASTSEKPVFRFEAVTDEKNSEVSSSNQASSSTMISQPNTGFSFGSFNKPAGQEEKPQQRSLFSASFTTQKPELPAAKIEPEVQMTNVAIDQRSFEQAEKSPISVSESTSLVEVEKPSAEGTNEHKQDATMTLEKTDKQGSLEEEPFPKFSFTVLPKENGENLSTMESTQELPKFSFSVLKEEKN
ncbi:nucleoporin Nup60 [Schizosaccharomyces pombe]|uniref:Nucleoporin nup60 n=1 Tax=Schizosaccharomyces pombe (strain 972 / ATCC 24843) TaxID=284812 RepID=NUP60_SCHPO|nr:nucleoporin Nup60 [Schizosaccharomyces pombe]O74500.1 RecName: Full=Nucleoporin nup60; AltName: Full=Nuclear pore protein nup60 [Schizosaccharomyces pombe 972h-]CAA20852.1 nucleoporin Nup60 [Schizosaccharomyces pombe]|eukprot:NP_588341.1 nucleoporin Nup60 [Schizosaccharomyces pombe]